MNWSTAAGERQVNPATVAAYALGKADLLIHGDEPDAICHGDKLLSALYEGERFEYILSKRWLSLLIRDNGACEYALATQPLDNDGIRLLAPIRAAVDGS